MQQARTNPRTNHPAQDLQLRINALFLPPCLDQETITHILRKEYGLSGQYHPLTGEREQNVLLQEDGGDRYVVKIFRHADAPGVIDIQTQALQHIKSGLPQISVPAIRNTLTGETIFRSEFAGEGELEIRVLDYLEGRPIEAGSAPTPMLAHGAGELVGKVTKQLSRFPHCRIEAFMPWDISNGLLGNPAFWSLGDANIRRYEGAVRQGYAEMLPLLLRQRTHLIYNDAHLGNLLRLSDHASEVSGLIDFGDLVHAPIICDVAVLALAFAENADDPVEMVASAVSGYHSSYPLAGQEVDMIFDLMIARQALSVLLFDTKLMVPRLQSDDLAKARTELMNGLDRLFNIDKFRITLAIREACGLRR